MIKKISIELILISLLAISCHTDNTKEVKNTKVLRIQEEDTFFEFTDYFKLKKIIYLETTEESAIGEFGKILLSNNRIYITDDMTNSIFVYNYDGEIISKICNQGKGPGEYIRLGDIDIDNKENNIYILDSEVHKIIKLNYNFKFLSEQKCRRPGSEFIKINDSFIYYCNNSSRNSICNNNKDFCYNLFIEKQNKIIHRGLPFYKSMRGFIFKYKYATILTRSNNIIYASETLNNIIYKVNENEIISLYKIDFGNKNVPDQLKRSKERLKENLNNYCHGIKNIYEDSELIFFTYIDKYTKGAVFEKPNYDFHNCKTIFDKVNGIPLRLINAKNYKNSNVLVSLLQPSLIINHYNNIKMKKNKEVSSITKKIMKRININNNPILIIYERK